MKIIISPAKDLNLENPIREDWNLNDNSKKIVDCLKNLDQDELKKLLKINNNLLEENLKYIEDFNVKKSYEAIYMYNGLAYRNMDLNNLDEDSKKYLEKHLLILSALYGPIKPFTKIKAYRLDFNMNLKIDNISIKKLWEEEYNKSINKGDTVLNLASDEFSNLFNREDYNWIDFEFYNIKNGEIKKHSTTSKKLRGKMLSYLFRNKIENVNLLKSISLEDYKYNKERSNDKLFVFSKEIN